jgi:hypothetical protein
MMKSFGMPMKRVSTAFLLCLLLPFSAGSETFFVRKILRGDMNTSESLSFLIQVDEGLKIILPKNRTFLKALELDIQIPAEFSAHQDALSYAFFTGIQPELTETITEYQGSPIHAAALPNRAGITLGIPYGQSHSLQSTPYLSVIPVLADEKTESIFFLCREGTKKIPPELVEAKIAVTVKPVFENKGFLELVITYRQGKEIKPVENPYTIFIDAKPMTGTTGRIVLETGSHHLAVVSDFYRSVVKTFAVAQGKTSKIEIELVDIAPTVVITAPANSEIYLDDVLFALAPGAEPVSLTQGQHSIRVILGGYEVQKSITLENGKSYRISVVFDAEFEEIR